MAFISKLAFYLVIIFAVGAFVWILFDLHWNKRSQRILYIIFGITLMIMAYSIWPGNESDLSRYFRILNGLQTLSFSEALRSGYYRNTPITNIFMWLIAKTGNNKWLPCISTGIIVLNTYFLINTEKRKNTKSSSNEGLYLILIYSVATLLAITTGVRQNWMVTVYSLAVYREFIKGKKDIWTVLLYMAACMIHTSAIVLVAVRVCSFVKGKLKIVFVLWMLLTPLLAKIASAQGIIGEAVAKFYGYQVIGNEGLDMRYLMARAGILAILAIMWLKIKDSTANKRYMNFYGTLLIISFGSIPVAHLFSRMANAVVYTSLPLINEFFKNSTFKEKFGTKIALMFFSSGLLAYHYVLIKNSVSFI